MIAIAGRAVWPAHLPHCFDSTWGGWGQQGRESVAQVGGAYIHLHRWMSFYDFEAGLLNNYKQ